MSILVGSQVIVVVSGHHRLQTLQLYLTPSILTSILILYHGLHNFAFVQYKLFLPLLFFKLFLTSHKTGEH
jgi:hypothetical protein